MVDRASSRGSHITERDRALLGFIAKHRFVLAAHAKVFLDASPSVTFARLSALARRRLIVHERLLHEFPGHYRVTRGGLNLIGSNLATPRIDTREYKHDIGVAWLWLTARGGAFGELREILAERELRSIDGRRGAGEEPLAVRLGGSGPGGHERLHYPDLLLIGSDGRRTALELELTSKSRTRRESILAGYAIDNRLDRVLYLVERDAVGVGVSTAVRKLGISGLVGIRRVQLKGCRQSLPSGRARGAVRAAGAQRVPATARATTRSRSAEAAL